MAVTSQPNLYPGEGHAHGPLKLKQIFSLLFGAHQLFHFQMKSGVWLWENLFLSLRPRAYFYRTLFVLFIFCHPGTLSLWLCFCTDMMHSGECNVYPLLWPTKMLFCVFPFHITSLPRDAKETQAKWYSIEMWPSRGTLSGKNG